MAVIALGGIVVSQSLRIGGYDFDDAITSHLKRVHTMAIGQQAAENLKLEIGSAMALDPELESEVRGRDSSPDSRRPSRLSSEELRNAYREPLRTIIDAVKGDARADAARAGGGHHYPRDPAGGRRRVASAAFEGSCETRRRCQSRHSDSPLTCVVLGAGHSLDEFDALEGLEGKAQETRPETLEARLVRSPKLSGLSPRRPEERFPLGPVEVAVRSPDHSASGPGDNTFMAPPIGESLHEARARRGIELSEVERATKIRAKYLRAMEEERWELLPGAAYARALLRTYGSFLGLDGKALVEEYGHRHEPVEDRYPEHEPLLLKTPGRGRPRRGSAARSWPGSRSRRWPAS